jgi:hypothetical protein
MAKRKVILLYGEKTVQINKRVPESKRKEIEKQFDTILESYRNPSEVEIDVANGRQVKYEQIKPKEVSVVVKQGSAPKKSTASGNDKWREVLATEEEIAEVASRAEKIESAKLIVPAIKFERIASLPLGTKLVKEYGKFGALRSLSDEQFFTKRMHDGKIEILRHESYESALLYANENFK